MEAKMHKMDAGKNGPYGRLLVMLVLSFMAMYVLMYAMVNTFANALSSLNQAYMAGLMTAPMVILELVVMGGMYPNKKWNALFLAGGFILLALCWVAIRQQVAISDRQFLKSMIPHHAGAILMCEKASLRDAEVKRLCTGIIGSQQGEIELMKAKLKALDAR